MDFQTRPNTFEPCRVFWILEFAQPKRNNYIAFQNTFETKSFLYPLFSKAAILAQSFSLYGGGRHYWHLQGGLRSSSSTPTTSSSIIINNNFNVIPRPVAMIKIRDANNIIVKESVKENVKCNVSVTWQKSENTDCEK